MSLSKSNARSITFSFEFFSLIGLIFLVSAFAYYSDGRYKLVKLYKINLDYTNDIKQKSKPCDCTFSNPSNIIASSLCGVIIAFLEPGIYFIFGFNSRSLSNNRASSILIPWQDISDYEIIEYREHKFYLGNPKITILTLGSETIRELEALSGIKISDRSNEKP